MPREPVSPPPTLGELREHNVWVWLYCPKWTCLRAAPMALTPAIIRWGSRASSDMLRERTRCSRCGHRGGVTLQCPSWDGPHIRFASFPAERLRASR
jgi:hypothetical protein